MNSIFKAGLAITAVAATAFSTVTIANAGGLWDRSSGGSLKDTYKPHHTGPAGKCYLRGDVGYSYASDFDGSVSSPNYPATEANNEDIDGAFFGEIGIGCGGSGDHGFRGDLTVGYYSDRDVSAFKTDRPGVHFPATLSSQINTLTAMANIYYDLGNYHNFVPYVGFGLGLAHHELDDVSFNFAGFPATNPIETIGGGSQTNFAWSLMAGAAYKVSHRTSIDFGYRYIDLGDVSTTGNICDTCVAGGSRDTVSVDDITAHEFKIGLRYRFGSGHSKGYK